MSVLQHIDDTYLLIDLSDKKLLENVAADVLLMCFSVLGRYTYGKFK
jgi:hypothetical protein